VGGGGGCLFLDVVHCTKLHFLMWSIALNCTHGVIRVDICAFKFSVLFPILCVCGCVCVDVCAVCVFVRVCVNILTLMDEPKPQHHSFAFLRSSFVAASAHQQS